VQVNEDSTVIVTTGSPDIGGSRASMALMAAETLGIDYHQIRSIVADTSSVGYTHVTGGSRVTFATGMAVIDASKKVVDELRARAAMIWDVDVDGVIWEDGCAKPASSNVGDFAPLSFKELAAKKALPAARSPPRPRSMPAAWRRASRPSSAMSRSIPRPAR
jgi:CO/xanthine dehydrogenase Mo-binding subunit